MNGGKSPYFVKDGEVASGLNERQLKKSVEKGLKEAQAAIEAKAFPAPAIETGMEKYMKQSGKNDTREGFAGAITYQYPFNGKLDLQAHGVDIPRAGWPTKSEEQL